MTDVEMQLEALKAAFSQLMAELGIGATATYNINDAFRNEYERLRAQQAEIAQESSWDN